MFSINGGVKSTKQVQMPIDLTTTISSKSSLKNGEPPSITSDHSSPSSNHYSDDKVTTSTPIGQLNSTSNRSSDDQLYICPICRRELTHLTSFVQHMSGHLTSAETHLHQMSPTAGGSSKCSDDTGRKEVYNWHHRSLVHPRSLLGPSDLNVWPTDNSDQHHDDRCGGEGEGTSNYKNGLTIGVVCRSCPNDFSKVGSLDNLLKHIKSHHLIPLFKCSFCSDTFETSDSCVKHVFNNHQDQFKIQSECDQSTSKAVDMSLDNDLAESANENNSLPSSQPGLHFDRLGDEMSLSSQLSVFQLLFNIFLSNNKTLGNNNDVMSGNLNDDTTQSLTNGDRCLPGEICQLNASLSTNCKSSESEGDRGHHKSTSLRRRESTTPIKRPYNDSSSLTSSSLLLSKKPGPVSPSIKLRRIGTPTATRKQASLLPPILECHPVKRLLPVKLAATIDNMKAAKLCHVCLKEFDNEMAVLRHQVQEHTLNESESC